LNREITLTCTAAVNATITLTVVDSEGRVLPVTDVLEMTGNSTSVNVTVVNTGQHNITCVADNGLTERAMEQFYGISKTSYDAIIMYLYHSLFLVYLTLSPKYLSIIMRMVLIISFRLINAHPYFSCSD
jgi:hypothetical protein